MRNVKGLIAGLGMVCVASAASLAQNHPVVLVHGFSSTPSTWANMFATLNASGFYTPYNPSVPWESSVSTQGSTLAQYMVDHSIGADAYLIGHSMGGLTARAASRIRSVTGIFTVGTPHGGAPIAGSHSALQSQLNGSYADYFGAHQALDNFVNTASFADPLYDAATDGLDDLNVSFPIWLTASAAALALNLDAQASMADLSFTNGYVPGLNASESSVSIAHRISWEVRVAGAGYAGPLALTSEPPAQADNDGLLIDLEAGFCGMDAMSLMFDGQGSQLDGTTALIAAGFLIDYSNRLATFSDWWNYSIVGGFPNDAVVPTANQHFPLGIGLTGLFGAHTHETSLVVGSAMAQLNAFNGR